jgi:hypothetical protein
LQNFLRVIEKRLREKLGATMEETTTWIQEREEHPGLDIYTEPL